MGRLRSKNSLGLPPGMFVRVRSNIKYYYYNTYGSDCKRKEYSLGKNKIEAISRWKALSTLQPLPKRIIPLRKWVNEELFKNTCARAKWKNIEFSITLNDIDELINKSKGKCSLTGIPFDLYRIKDGKCRVRPWAPSIDRIDCSHGYTANNIRLVASAVNIALNDFGEEVLTRIAMGIIKVKYGKNLV